MAVIDKNGQRCFRIYPGTARQSTGNTGRRQRGIVRTTDRRKAAFCSATESANTKAGIFIADPAGYFAVYKSRKYISNIGSSNQPTGSKGNKCICIFIGIAGSVAVRDRSRGTIRNTLGRSAAAKPYGSIYGDLLKIIIHGIPAETTDCQIFLDKGIHG